jgi:hypothetical protein
MGAIDRVQLDRIRAMNRRYVALCGGAHVASSDDLETLLGVVRAVQAGEKGEDVACWDGYRLVHVFLSGTADSGGVEISFAGRGRS